jgi:hypothetical protein
VTKNVEIFLKVNFIKMLLTVTTICQMVFCQTWLSVLSPPPIDLIGRTVLVALVLQWNLLSEPDAR